MGAYTAPPLSAHYLDYQVCHQTTAIPSTSTTLATSTEIPGLTVSWTHGIKTVEVVYEGTLQFTGVSQSANTFTAVVSYICDLSLASNGIYDNWSLDSTALMFSTTGTGVWARLGFRAVAQVTAAPGTAIALSGRTYISNGAASTWSLSVHGGSLTKPAIIYAREID